MTYNCGRSRGQCNIKNKHLISFILTKRAVFHMHSVMHDCIRDDDNDDDDYEVGHNDHDVAFKGYFSFSFLLMCFVAGKNEKRKKSN